ncbi:MAG: class A beta-lactamase, subclass A2 [Chitinophagaceae bacterium]|nr:class A beta-lactamase, subclass A2 [Chitinophagaceae bacterium]
MKRKLFLLNIVLLLCTQLSIAQQSAGPDLQQQLELLVKEHKSRIGVAINAGDEVVRLHNEHHYPMQSVFKFPLALAILKKVDEGALSLEQKIHISRSELHRNTWSPMREEHPKGNLDLSVAELLRYSVSMSDNNACDILFRVAGGPASVNQYIHSIGIQEIQIAATEHEMHQSWPVQYTNWCTPAAMNEMLTGFQEGKYLSASGTAFLLKLMTASSNSDKRIKGLLPPSATVAHKTGSSGTNKSGLTAATNDAGIISLPDGRRIFITVFVSDAMESYDANEAIIARIAKAAFDHYSGNK